MLITVCFDLYASDKSSIIPLSIFVKQKEIDLLPIGTVFHPSKDRSTFNGGVVTSYAYYEHDNELIMTVEARIYSELLPYLKKLMLEAGYKEHE